MGTAIPVEDSLPRVNLSDFGAVVDDGQDDGDAIQAAIDRAAALGGAEVQFEAGRYDINVSGEGPFPRISASQHGVVLRGAGSGEEGTRVHLNRPMRDERSEAIFFARGDFRMEMLAEVSAPAMRGDQVLEVTSTAMIQAGDFVRLELHDEAAAQSPEMVSSARLATMMTTPYALLDTQTETLGAPGATVGWTTRVDDVVDATHVALAQPLRVDAPLHLAPRLLAYLPVHDVGIVGMRLTTAWPGQYAHHRPYPHDAEGQDVVRSTQEQDYLWTAIQLNRCADCWVRDVVIENANQGIMLYESVFVTLEDIVFSGHLAHVGIGLTRSHSVLSQRLHFTTRFVHSLLVANHASGNVFRYATWEGEGGYDPVSTADHVIDMHGLFPFENLYELMDGFYVHSGGPRERLPHAGVRNTFWNVVAPASMRAQGESDQFFQSFAEFATSDGSSEKLYELWPQAFVVGGRREGMRPLRIGETSVDLQDTWRTIEHANQGQAEPASLYDAQRALRFETYDPCLTRAAAHAP